ncbi:MAG: amino acid ABC transporter permease [Clostridia bacterium]
MNSAVFMLLLKGAKITVQMFFTTIIFAIPLGLLISSMRMSKHWFLNIPARIFILFLRGTPLMLQILFIYFGPSLIKFIGFSWQGNRMLAAAVALILNYSAYIAEIFRGGIEGIPLGQREAGKVLGLTKIQTFFIIILPQVVKRVLPPLGNEIINLVKDTSLIQVLGISELMMNAKQQASKAVSIMPYAVAALIYLAINAVVSKALSFCEKKLDYYR